MPGRKSNLDQDNTDRWLMTYADLITLLLAFFVMMYAISHVDSERFDKMSQKLQGLLRGGNSSAENAADKAELGSGVLKVGKLKMIAERLQNSSQNIGDERASFGAHAAITTAKDSSSIKADGLKNEPISVELNERGLVIHILESALFESGQASLKPDALKVLDKIAAEIRHVPNQIRIEGHTDDRSISTYRFPSNWELSTARATTVVRYFVEKLEFKPTQLSALGFGEFRPMVANDSDTSRAKNRRVDIVVLTEELSHFEPLAVSDGKFIGPRQE